MSTLKRKLKFRLSTYSKVNKNFIFLGNALESNKI